MLSRNLSGIARTLDVMSIITCSICFLYSVKQLLVTIFVLYQIRRGIMNTTLLTALHNEYPTRSRRQALLCNNNESWDSFSTKTRFRGMYSTEILYPRSNFTCQCIVRAFIAFGSKTLSSCIDFVRKSAIVVTLRGTLNRNSIIPDVLFSPLGGGVRFYCA